MSLTHFWSVFLARNREFIRDRSSWAWNLFFPVLLIAGLAVMFGNDNRAVLKVGVYPVKVETESFFKLKHVQLVNVDALDSAILRVKRHQFDLLLDTQSKRYWVNDTSPNGYIAEQLLLANNLVSYKRELISGREIRYVDWALPGILGLNMMFACLFGVGYVIVRYRKSGVLKRLKATPLAAIEFLSAQVASRLWLVMAITLSVFFGTHYFLDFTMHGNYLSLILTLTIGAISLITLGLLVAARTASEELAGGLLNLFTWPMMVMSGVWFSLEGAHPIVKAAAQMLPLTHIVEAARAIMIDGASLFDVRWHIMFLLTFTTICTFIGVRLFRWE